MWSWWLPPAFEKCKGLYFFQNWSKFMTCFHDWLKSLYILSGAAQCSSHHVKNSHRPTDDCPVSLTSMSRYVLLLFCGNRKSSGNTFHEKRYESSFSKNWSNISKTSDLNWFWSIKKPLSKCISNTFFSEPYIWDMQLNTSAIIAKCYSAFQHSFKWKLFQNPRLLFSSEGNWA